MLSNRDKIIFLKRFIILDREIDRKVEEITKWRSRLGKVTPTLTLQPGGGGSIYKSSDTDIVNRIVDLEQEINRDIDILVDIRGEIGTVIDAVENHQERLLLQYRYLDGKTFEWIAAEMFYSWRHTHRLHSAALLSVKIKEVIECHIDKVI